MKTVTLPSVAWYQLRRQACRPSTWITLATCCLLTGVSVVLGLREFDARAAQYTRSLQQLVQDQLRVSVGFSGRQVEPALRAIRPPSPGAVIARGAEPLGLASWDFGPGGRIPAAGSSSMTDDEVSADGPLDVEFLVRVVGGFLAILLSVRMLADDRESGLTRALCGFPVRPSTLAAGALLGQTAVLLIGLAVAGVVAGVIVVVKASEPEVFLSVRHGLLTAAPVAAAYLLLLLSLGALIGTAIRRAASAYAVAFVLWLVIAVLAPQVLTMAARLIVPLTPRATMVTERDDAFAEVTRNGEERLGRVAEAFATADGSSVSLSIDAHRTALEATWNDDVAVARARARLIENAWNDRLAKRRRVILWGNWISPGSRFSSAVANAAQTGVIAEQTWNDLTAAYQESLNQQLFDHRPHLIIRVRSDDSFKLFSFDSHPPPRLIDLPPFTPPLPSQQRGGWAVAVAAGQLMTYALATMAMAVWMFGRRHLDEPADRR